MKRPSKRWQILLAVTLLLYACGYLTQFIGNYAVWQKNGGMPGGTSPPFSSLTPLACLKGILWFPYSLYCMAGCAAAVAAIFLYRKLFSQDALTDSERNFDFSAKGTYGTSGWMQPREIPAVLNIVSDLSQHTGTVLGILDGRFLCIPEKTRMNGNLAVYGASGSMKTRSFCMNRILQSAARGESLIICDPKSELYEKSSEYMRVLGYTVRVFNLVSPENSDSWNCLKEIEGQELMAQLFVDVIIKNTNGTGKSDRFWDSGEMNLLKALVLYVDLTYPPEQRNIGEVYNLITQCSESQLDSLFDVLPLTHPAKAPYSLYQRASDSVRSGVISGLGSRLQVFQSELIKKITAYDEISLELPGQQPCAYYLVTSDQDSTFDFLASLFLSFAFIKLVRYADANCPRRAASCSGSCAGRGIDRLWYDFRIIPAHQRHSLPQHLYVLRIPESCRSAKPLSAEPVAGDFGQLRCAAFSRLHGSADRRIRFPAYRHRQRGGVQYLQGSKHPARLRLHATIPRKQRRWQTAGAYPG